MSPASTAGEDGRPLGSLPRAGVRAARRIAARLVERVGRFTGELAEPPLTADGRASMAARLAADHKVDLADCHAYGDSLADLPMLELVGHPHPINPDFRLSREARRRRWPIENWTTERAAI